MQVRTTDLNLEHRSMLPVAMLFQSYLRRLKGIDSQTQALSGAQQLLQLAIGMAVESCAIGVQ